MADEEWSDDVEDERDTSLADVVSVPGVRLLNRYDFGDGWECYLVLEKALDPLSLAMAMYPRGAGVVPDFG